MLKDKETGGLAFYAAFYKFITEHSTNKKERDLLKQELFTTKHQSSGSLVTFEDWEKDLTEHPEFAGMTTGQISEDMEHGGRAYSQRYNSWVRKQTSDPREQKELRERLFRRKNHDWTTNETVEDWQDELDRNPALQGMTIGQIAADTMHGGCSLYSRFMVWVRRETNEREQQEELKRIVFRYHRKHLYAIDNLPLEFQKKVTKSEKKSEKKVSHLGTRIEVKNPSLTTFVKGEAFEQLVGVTLAYASPEELVIPQYCLDTGIKPDGQGYFRNRIDFMVGDQFYEVKWGNLVDNIQKTLDKQLPYIEADKQYHLVRFDQSINMSVPDNVQSESFSTLLQKKIADEKAKSTFETLGVILLELAGPRENIENVRLLRNMRDYLYTLIDEGNTKRGSARLTFIRNKLQQVINAAYEDKETFASFLSSHKKVAYAPTEAYFMFNDQLYRGFIDVHDLHEENPEKYTMIYSFGNVEFTNELDRNIAVMIELSEFGINIENCLETPLTLQDKPIFRLPNGKSISQQKIAGVNQIASLEDVKKILQISDDDYAFGRMYIEENGLQC
jgi:hypothetical protein